MRLLKTAPLETVLKEVARLPAMQTVNPLIAGLFLAGGLAKWHAVSALGRVMAVRATEDMEAARIVMRRLMWSLNDESGGIGWGAAEAMGEIMACHEGLAAEYAHMLVAYMREDGFYLELPALQRGLMWALGRLAGVKPDLLRKWQAAHYLEPYLDSLDPEVRALAAQALGLLDATETKEKIAGLAADATSVTLYNKGSILDSTVGAFAREALTRLDHA